MAYLQQRTNKSRVFSGSGSPAQERGAAEEPIRAARRAWCQTQGVPFPSSPGARYSCTSPKAASREQRAGFTRHAVPSPLGARAGMERAGLVVIDQEPIRLIVTRKKRSCHHKFNNFHQVMMLPAYLSFNVHLSILLCLFLFTYLFLFKLLVSE